MIRLATDVGGTFTDLLGYDEQSGKIYCAKSLTTTDDQSNGVINTISMARAADGLEPEQVGFFVHGGTTVINAITERKGVKTALVTTRGFRDVLAIGRGTRPDLYNLRFHTPAPYVERALRFEITERIGANGQVIEKLNTNDMAKVAQALIDEDVAAVAILFINSYANPEHETECAKFLAEKLPGSAICCSHEITSLWREYERSNTVVLNAYVKPIVSSYFQKLETKLVDAAIRCAHNAMLSNGGVASFRQASAAPLNLVESGPSGGVAGAVRIGEFLDEPNVLAFDVGGTTAKCSVIVDGKPRVFSEYKMGWSRHSPGYPVQVPVVDIVEIGAGGGSIARVDKFGVLTVGPQSAGSNPGPVCYGFGGTEPTVTDAKLLTGVINPDSFADGKIKLNVTAATQAMANLGKQLGLNVERTAQAILHLAEANMVGALKLVTIQRGYDPRDFSLVVTGGGGPLFAASLGRELNVKRVIIPPHAGIFSAWGMLAAKPRVDMRKTWFRELGSAAIASLEDELNVLRQSATDYFGHNTDEKLNFDIALQLRYRGQEHSVTTHVGKKLDIASITNHFHSAHKKAYSFDLVGTMIEITGIHVVAELQSAVISCPKVEGGELTKKAALTGHRKVFEGSEQEWANSAVYDREKLPPGLEISGPALVEELTTTTLVLSGQTLHRNERGLLIIREENQK